MSKVIACAKVTKELYELLCQQGENIDRDALIHQIEHLLEKRASYLAEIKHPFTKQEELLGKQIVEWNKFIDKKIRSIYLQVQEDVQGVKKTKSTVQKYINPYESLQLDGVYYDKRN